jgi:hypothetical protein
MHQPIVGQLNFILLPSSFVLSLFFRFQHIALIIGNYNPARRVTLNRDFSSTSRGTQTGFKKQNLLNPVTSACIAQR